MEKCHDQMFSCLCRSDDCIHAASCCCGSYGILFSFISSCLFSVAFSPSAANKIFAAFFSFHHTYFSIIPCKYHISITDASCAHSHISTAVSIAHDQVYFTVEAAVVISLYQFCDCLWKTFFLSALLPQIHLLLSQSEAESRNRYRMRRKLLLSHIRLL